MIHLVMLDVISFALGVVAKVKTIAQIEKEADIDRKALYKTLSQDSASRFDKINHVIHTLSLKLTVQNV
ncbi:DNA-binding protein [Acinetobacter sp. YH12205]|uniref:helix-turn-helix domain-containing transcriptional regulator n=1 Tax=Acinetobacter sp. YH12205 TaxID=2601141 RepID=UPI0015D2D175|nr:hypothetical protein [Acinetobacter sp. YH12205]